MPARRILRDRHSVPTQGASVLVGKPVHARVESSDSVFLVELLTVGEFSFGEVDLHIFFEVSGGWEKSGMASDSSETVSCGVMDFSSNESFPEGYA